MSFLKPSKSAILSRDFSMFGSDTIEVPLVNGIADNNDRREYRVILEPLNGRDEEGISRVGKDFSLPVWVSRLLGDKAIHSHKAIGEDVASALSVADRDLLTLYLRMLTFGPELWGITECPFDGCGAKLDFSFDLRSLSLPARGENAFDRYGSVNNQSVIVDFIYREPTGLDQIAIAGLAATGPYEAWLNLLSGCILKLGDKGGHEASPRALEKLPAEILEEIDNIISRGMKSLDWDIGLCCPKCEKEFISTVDIQAFFWEELMYSFGNFQDDVHTLAFYYHWSEADILSLTRWKRQMYVRHIEKQLR